MVGWLLLSAEDTGWRVRLAGTAVRGLPLLQARVPAPPGLGRRRWERRVDRAARLLARAGCRRVLAAEDFRGWAILERRGLGRVETAGLCRALAAPLLLARLAAAEIPPRRAVVGLYGRRVDRDCFQTAQLLCPQVRQLVIDVPDGGAGLAQALREEYGAAVLEAAPRRTDAAACFAPVERPPARALILYGPRPCLDGLALRPAGEPLPAGADPAALAALLWEEGRLPLGEILIVPQAGAGG